MNKKDRQKAMVIFEHEPVRRIWVEKDEQWYFSIIDVIRVLTDSIDSPAYWRKLKQRLKEEGNQTVTNCHGFKILAPDNKMRQTDCFSTENLLRLVQSIPSPKAEPFKLWLAKVGYERLKETVDPEIGVNRARNNWKSLGRSEQWITQRMRGQEIRNKLTDYWSEHEVTQEKEYALLTDIIHKEWADLTTRQHKSLKKLKQENLRDHMSEAELLFTALAELSTAQIAQKEQAVGYNKNVPPAKKGGAVAKRARKDYELQTGQKVVTGINFLPSERNKRIRELEEVKK